MAVRKVLGVKLHPQGACEDCPAQWPSSPLARQQAKDHAQQTGHTVQTETVTRDRYRRTSNG